MRRLSKVLVVLVTVLCMASVAAAQPPPAEHRILVQADAPIGITEYTARDPLGSRRESDTLSVIAMSAIARS